MTSAAMAALQRLRRTPAANPEATRCEFCAQPLAPRHEHVITVDAGTVQCACIACALLFDREGQPLRRLPRDARFLAGFDLEPLEWAALAIPVKLAFLTGLEAHYPSPGGLVTAAIEREVWDDIGSRHTELQSIRPGLEALLVNYLEQPHQLFIAPLDQCYRLAGLVRSAWTGFSGGPDVGRIIRAFCLELRGELVHA
ncbi:MAG: DUF5947 family protein [Terriglobales bacterium]